ncbi:hypothetical protein LIA77_11446 [Sarocladium implicatum]|nr:hypothetical protein LIA77_11446 [Sarocladium implicatum]
MRHFFSTAALLTAASSTFVSAADTIFIQWATTLHTGEEIMSASLNGSVVSTACGNKLILGNVEFEVDGDAKARGLLAVKTRGQRFTYDLSDGDICGGLWNSDFAQVRCYIPLRVDPDLSISSMVETAKNCFPLAGASPGELFPYDPTEDSGVDDEEGYEL